MKTNSELRLYTFCNFYLSSIQQGIQSAHVASALTAKYRKSRSKAAALLTQWENFDRTMIVLNGGPAFSFMADYENVKLMDEYVSQCPYPFALFSEEIGALHPDIEVPTCWGIVLPPSVYNAKPTEVFPSRNGFSQAPIESPDAEVMKTFWEEGSHEHLICTILQGKGLAR